MRNPFQSWLASVSGTRWTWLLYSLIRFVVVKIFIVALIWFFGVAHAPSRRITPYTASKSCLLNQARRPAGYRSRITVHSRAYQLETGLAATLTTWSVVIASRAIGEVLSRLVEMFRIWPCIVTAARALLVYKNQSCTRWYPWQWSVRPLPMQ